MSFFSLIFLAFLAVLVTVYFLIPKRFQWICLLIASYVFYIWSGGGKALVFIGATTVTVFLGGLGMNHIQEKNVLPEGAGKDEKKKAKEAVQKKKRKVMVLIVVFNIFLLGLVKYSGFIISSINGLLSEGSQIPIPTILLPLGISFYTFQSLGYLIDVYRGKVKADRNIFRFALFVSYFPQIVQGPISRYGQLAHQLYEEHSFDYRRVRFGAERMLWGFFKKIVIADRIAVVVDNIFANYMNETYVGFIPFLGALLYGIQVYIDFSGGMDIAIGISQVLGIEQVENFRQPFNSKSVAEFWQRWHITLGAWMKEYVFYPLALSKGFSKMGKRLRKVFGNKAAKIIPTSIASFIVFFLVGVWHGASWNFVVYGFYQAIFVSTNTLFAGLYAGMRKACHVNDKSASWQIFQILRTVVIVTFGRYLSRATGFMHAFDMWKATFASFNPWVFFDGTMFNLGLSPANFILMIILIVIIFIVDALHERGFRFRENLDQKDIVFRWVVYFLMLFGIIILGVYGSAYDAGNFIYQGF